MISNTNTTALTDLQINLEPRVQFIILSENQMNEFLDESLLKELLLGPDSVEEKDEMENENEKENKPKRKGEKEEK